MQFSDTTNLLGLIQECEEITDLGDTGISGSTNLLKHFTRRINNALEDILSTLITELRNWPIGDSNLSAISEITKTLTAGTREYQILGSQVSGGTGLDTTNPVQAILGAAVKDSAGIWKPLTRIHLRDIQNQGVDAAEYKKTDGLPTEYELREDWMKLYPGPAAASVTLASGLKVYGLRKGSTFVSTDTTKVPGIPSQFHPLIAQKACLTYIAKYKKESLVWLKNEITEGMAKLVAHYGQRDKDNTPRFIVANHSNK